MSERPGAGDFSEKNFSPDAKKNTQEKNPERFERREEFGRVVAVSRTERGAYHAERQTGNEDAIHVDARIGFAAVYDGMGGHGHGGEASFEANQLTKKSLLRFLRPQAFSPEEIGHELESMIKSANSHLNKRRKELNYADDALRSTAVLAKLWQSPEGAYKAIVAYAGDSRAYVRKKSGETILVTADHLGIRSAIDDMLSDNKVAQKISDSDYLKVLLYLDRLERPEKMEKIALGHLNLSPGVEKHRVSIEKMLPLALRFVGGPNKGLGLAPEIEPDVRIVDLEPGDVLMLATDGVYKPLAPEELGDALGTQVDTQAVYDRIRGKTKDDATIGVLAVRSPETLATPAKKSIDSARPSQGIVGKRGPLDLGGIRQQVDQMRMRELPLLQRERKFEQQPEKNYWLDMDLAYLVRRYPGEKNLAKRVEDFRESVLSRSKIHDANEIVPEHPDRDEVNEYVRDGQMPYEVVWDIIQQDLDNERKLQKYLRRIKREG